MSKTYTVVIQTDNPNVKRFNPSTNVYKGTDKQISKYIHELMFNYYIENNGMTITLSMSKDSTNV